MNDLISRSALIADIEETVRFSTRSGVPSAEVRGANKIVSRIELAPAVDAVEVVRCRDCKWYKKSKRYDYYRCGNPCEGMVSGVELMPYDYCSYGEMRAHEEK